MRPPFLVLAALLALPLAAGCGSPSEPTPPDDPEEEETVAPEGGVISSDGGKVTLTVPSGAVSEETPITVTPVEAPPSDPLLVPGTAYDFGPDGLTFQEPVTMELRYDESSVRQEGTEARLRLHRWEGSAWRPVPAGRVDLAGDRVSAEVTSFSTYAVVEDPCVPAPLATDTTVTARLTAGDCQVELEEELRYEELFSVETGEVTAFRVRMESSEVLPATGLLGADGERTSALLLASSEPAEGDVAGFTVVAGPGDYRLYAASPEAAEGDFELSLTSGSPSNGLGCAEGQFLVPPVPGIAQSLDDSVDCVVTIEFPAIPDVDGEETVEEYFWIGVPAGATATVTTTRTGGDPDFAPFPTLFLGNGEVVQTDGDPSASSKTITHTAARDRFLLLGVSATLDGDFEYTQGTYDLSVSVE